MTKLKIQQGDSVENTSSAVIDKLYRLALSIEGNNILLTGNIQSSAAYEDAVKYLAGKIGTALNSQGRFEGLTITILNDNYYIRFADPAVEPVLISNGYSLDGVGISKSDALRATNIKESLFRENLNLYTFDELGQFGNITIKNDAFHGCTNLISIDLSNVTKIQNAAFLDCTGLTGDLALPALLSTTGEHHFRNTSITSISDLGSVSKISDNCFRYCPLLQSVVLPNTITEIGNCAFYLCSNLNTITFPQSLIKVGALSFYSCPISFSVNDIQNILEFVGTRDGGWRSTKNYGLNGSPAISGSTLSLPNALKIGACSFHGEQFTTINLPNLNLISANNTFSSNPDLTSVTLGGTFTTFDEDYFYGAIIGMFDGCTNLNTVTVNAPITHIPTAMFSKCSPTNINIDFDKITKIGKNAFGRFDVTNKVLSFKNVTEICYGVLKHSTGLRSDLYGFSDSVSNISIYLPKLISTNTMCNLYKHYNLPECSVFYDIRVGRSNWSSYKCVYNTIYFRDIQNIDAGAFFRCNIKSLIINNVQPPSIIQTTYSNAQTAFPTINTDLFCGVESIDNIYVPDSAVSTYQNNSLYSSMASKIKGISQCPVVTLAQLEQGSVGVISDCM